MLSFFELSQICILILKAMSYDWNLAIKVDRLDTSVQLRRYRRLESFLLRPTTQADESCAINATYPQVANIYCWGYLELSTKTQLEADRRVY